MTFAEAAGFVLTSGQHKGKTLGDVGSREEGLLYIDSWFPQTPGELVAQATYLSHPAVRADLERLAAERE